MAKVEPRDVKYLYDLARDKTAAGRRALVATMGDLFSAQHDILTDRERVLMTEILRVLVHDVELSVRRALAEKIAGQPFAPHELVVALANDEAEVALPLLVNCDVLQDIELIEIIRNRTLEHQLAISIRKNLSEEVTDSLVATDSVDVIKTLLENHQAKISQRTLEYLVEQSQRLDTYQNPLLRRPDLDTSLAKRMYWWVSAALRSFILEKFPVDPAELDQTMEAAVKSLTAAEAPPPKAVALADELFERQQVTPQFMLETLREGEVALFAALFAKYAGIRLVLVQRMLFEPGGEGLAIACRGCGIDRSTFASMFMLTRKARGRDQVNELSELATILGLYDRVSAEAAELLLKKWQRDPSFLRAIWQIEQPPRAEPRS